MPRLTEQEQQEIIRFVEADKYRFLLFEDKREMERVYNNVLPFQIIEQLDEPRAEKQAETAIQLSLFDRDRQFKGCSTSSPSFNGHKNCISSPWRQYVHDHSH